MSQAIILEGNHRISTVLDLDCKSNGYAIFRIDVVMLEVDDSVFSSTWPHCLELKFSESFKSESSVSSRVELDSIPIVILNIGMKIHSNEERRTKGIFSTQDSALFTYKYLEKNLSDAELTKLRDHPHERGVFWTKLEKQGLVFASGNSQLPMLPLFILLMTPKSQKESVKKLEDGTFPTSNRLFIPAMNASCNDDNATAELLSNHSSKSSVTKLNDALQKIGNKDNAGIDNEEKSDGSDFVLHEKIDEIEKSSICFFYQTIPTDDVQQMISKKLNHVVAEPSGETIKELAKWPADQIMSTTLNSSVYNGHGGVRSCFLSGERLLPKGSRHLAPVSSRKLSSFVSKWFPGRNDGKIHTVRGFLLSPKELNFNYSQQNL
ncbi:hypothetical protein CRE_04941 [Caenorhabditis remanei]|uniref:Uncharacterized protein n=1 Tax=Caenorhabditis remanei TaxID=31234 RepID=E3MNG7_CAERE|nr:hypothetical protein CRE_04941 [Caenorhabditis remanei]